MLPQESVHTIWCPPSWTPEQTWEHIARGNRVPTSAGEQNGQWVSVEIEGGELRDGFWRGGRLARIV